MKIKKQNCFIHNYGQHYRFGIFKKLNDELGFDFYFGDKIPGNIKKLEYEKLSNYKGELKNFIVVKSPIYYQIGSVPLIFKPYKNYLMLGEYYCISTWIILLMAKLFNKNVFLWTHGFYGKESPFLEKLKLRFYNLSKGVFLYGNYSKSIMVNKGFNESKLHVIYNSLEYEMQLRLRKSLTEEDIFFDKFKNSNPNLIFIGRLTKVKKLDLLLESIHELNNYGIKVNLTLIGDGPVQEELIALDKSLGLNTWFFGQSYDEEEISKFIFNADLCVSPGNVGLTAVHCMTYGTPVITHDRFDLQMPEFEAIQEGVSGSFFEYNSVGSLAKTIENWLKASEGKREKIRRSCFKIIDSKYNPNFQVSQISNVIKGI